MFVIFLLLFVVGLYFVRMKFINDVLWDMKDDYFGFVSFYYIVFLDEWFKCIIGIIVFFLFLKLFCFFCFNCCMLLF